MGVDVGGGSPLACVYEVKEALGEPPWLDGQVVGRRTGGWLMGEREGEGGKGCRHLLGADRGAVSVKKEWSWRAA